MHIGMIVGIGPAATDFYYRYLISAMARRGHDLQLTMAHADTPTLLRNQTQGNEAAQVAIYLALTQRLMSSGIDCIAVTSIAGHFCIEAFKKVSPVPVIDAAQPRGRPPRICLFEPEGRVSRRPCPATSWWR